MSIHKVHKVCYHPWSFRTMTMHDDISFNEWGIVLNCNWFISRILKIAILLHTSLNILHFLHSSLNNTVRYFWKLYRTELLELHFDSFSRDKRLFKGMTCSAAPSIENLQAGVCQTTYLMSDQRTVLGTYYLNDIS